MLRKTCAQHIMSRSLERGRADLTSYFKTVTAKSTQDFIPDLKLASDPFMDCIIVSVAPSCNLSTTGSPLLTARAIDLSTASGLCASTWCAPMFVMPLSKAATALCKSCLEPGNVEVSPLRVAMLDVRDRSWVMRALRESPSAVACLMA